MLEIDKKTIYTSKEYRFKNYTQLSLIEKKQMLEWRNDDSIRKYMYNTHIISIEDHLAFINSLNGRNDKYYWMISDENDIVGSMNLTDVDYNKGAAELGYYMSPNLIGNGGGFHFIFSILEFAFNTLNFHSLYGSTHIDNKAATLIDEYLGFEKIGEKSLLIDSKEVIFMEHILKAVDFNRTKNEKQRIENLFVFLKNKKNLKKNKL